MCLRRFSAATVYYRRIDLISWPFTQSYLHPPPGEWYNFLTSTSPCFTGFETL